LHQHAETGMQPGHTGRGVDLAGIALAAGFPDAVTVRTEQELEARAPKLLAARGPLFTVIKVSTDPAPTALPPRDGPYLRSRFRDAVRGAGAHR
jgi:thiamine pyrophosphate-dependent acetolactate synthase large subunit-like protein